LNPPNYMAKKLLWDKKKRTHAIGQHDKVSKKVGKSQERLLFAAGEEGRGMGQAPSRRYNTTTNQPAYPSRQMMLHPSTPHTMRQQKKTPPPLATMSRMLRKKKKRIDAYLRTSIETVKCGTRRRNVKGGDDGREKEREAEAPLVCQLIALSDPQTGATYFVAHVRRGEASDDDPPPLGRLMEARRTKDEREGWVGARDGSIWQILGEQAVEALMARLEVTLGEMNLTGIAEMVGDSNKLRVVMQSQ
jgi:hypothetical protein